MSERGPNDIDLGYNDRGIVLHALVLWNATCYEKVNVGNIFYKLVL
jgi:hypothetical protein